MLLEELILSPLNSLKGISVTEEKPYGFPQININRRAVLRQYYGKDVRDTGTSEGVMRYTYGFNRKNLSVNADVTNSVTKPFNYYLHNISQVVHNFLLSR